MKRSTDQLEAALTLRESGLTYREIGKKFGVGPQRATQLCALALRNRRRPPEKDPMYGLPNRIINVLHNVNVHTREEALAALNSGVINSKKLRNFGAGGMDELCKWLGVDTPIRRKHLCPHCGKVSIR